MSENLLLKKYDFQKIRDLTHLNYTKASQASASHLPCFGDRWGEFVERMREKIHLRFENVNEVILFAQTKVNFTHRFGASSVQHLFDLYECQLAQEYPQYKEAINTLSDSPYAPEGTTVIRNEKIKSNIIYYYIRILFSCMATIPAPKIVGEIGGGLGELGRLWAINAIHQPQNIIFIDIPESLFFCETFIRMNFPELECYYVND